MTECTKKRKKTRWQKTRKQISAYIYLPAGWFRIIRKMWMCERVPWFILQPQHVSHLTTVVFIYATFLWTALINFVLTKSIVHSGNYPRVVCHAMGMYTGREHRWLKSTMLSSTSPLIVRFSSNGWQTGAVVILFLIASLEACEFKAIFSLQMFLLLFCQIPPYFSSVWNHQLCQWGQLFIWQ